ncbi:collagen-like protein [Bdellovibrio sp. HCB288]|uniref:collagen-like triple helix repeat-containing protein n=1 Tax=Bdellovibrio sp. HCB288 TaxID=3394355 RepID=UPI0039B473A6
MKSSLLHKILVLGLCLSVGACAFKKEDAEDKQRQELADVVTQQLDEKKEKIAFEGTLTKENVSVRFDENETPGSYNMVIEWPDAVGMMEVTLNGRVIGSFKEKSFSISTPHSQKYQIVLRAYATLQEGGGFLSSIGIEKEAHKDFILDGIYNLSKAELFKVNRAYLRKGSKIVTNGHNLEINTNKLYVEASDLIGNEYDRAQIATFPFDRKSINPNELSPGRISIIANQAFGDLMISMIGVTGYDAKLITETPAWKRFMQLPSKATKGSSGADGILTVPPECEQLPFNAKEVCKKLSVCLENPKDGNPGAQGANGLNGVNGNPGGNTGDLVIDIKNDSEFNASVYRKAGLGGMGSSGTPGQLGGDGGDPGKNPENRCKNAAQGPRGADGAHGKDGTRGPRGAYGQITTNIKLDKTDN